MRATIVILLLCVASAGAAWWLLREDPPRIDPTPTPAAAPVQPDATPAPDPKPPTPTERVEAEPAGELRIDIRVADVIVGDRVIGCSVELWQRLPEARPPAPTEVKRATATSRAGGVIAFTELTYGAYVLRVHDDGYTGEDVAIELTNEVPLGQAVVLVRKRE